MLNRGAICMTRGCLIGEHPAHDEPVCGCGQVLNERHVGNVDCTPPLDGGASVMAMPSGLAPALRGLGARRDAPAAHPIEDET